MKDIFTLFLIFVFLISCDLGKKTYSKYELLNVTDHEIILYSYNRSNQTLQKTIQLLKKGDKWESEKFQTSRPGGQILLPTQLLEGDSLRVVFNGKKVLNFIGIYTSNNLLYEENYKLILVDENQTIRRYSFTEQDYENAEEL